MKFTFIERFLIPQLFPPRGNIMTMRLVSDITHKVQFTEKEMGEYEIRFFPDGRIEWKNQELSEKGKKEFDIDLSGSELKFLQDRVGELDKENAITYNMLELCEKIKKCQN
jgi:hypothetical protein